MFSTALLAQATPELSRSTIILAIIVVAVAVVFFSFVMLLVKRYKRCPSNRVLVIYGKVGGGNTVQVHSRRRRLRPAADPGLRLPEPGADPDRNPAQGRPVDREHPRQRAQRVHRRHRHRPGDACRTPPSACSA